MSFDDILAQGRRVEQALAQAQAEPDPAALKTLYAPEELLDVTVPTPGGPTVRLMYLKSTADVERVRLEVIGPLTTRTGSISEVLPRFTAVASTLDAQQKLLGGAALLFCPDGVLAADMPSATQRSIQEPTSEPAFFSPKDALIEQLDTNVGLVRYHLRDPRLRVDYLSLGSVATARAAVIYVDGVADPDLVDEARQRLAEFRPTRPGFVTSLLRPLYGAIWDGFLPADFTERPYRIADFVSRGRLAILVDGSPFAMITPILFSDLFIDEEEYLQASSTRYFVRALRFLAFHLALLAPGLFSAIMSVNPTIVPGLLAVAVTSSRQSLPYPVFTELLVLMIVVDILAEATISQKSLLGPAISIVGGLVAGQAAIRANLASDLGVIVVSVTMLSTFLTARTYITYSVRVWKYLIFFISSSLGVVGWATGVMLLVAVFTSRRQFGVQYLAPFSPLLRQDLGTQAHYERDRSPAPRGLRRPRPAP